MSVLHRFYLVIWLLLGGPLLGSFTSYAETSSPDVVPAPPVSPDAKPTEGKSSTVENAVVKVFSTVRYPDVYKPWTKQSRSDITGSGVVIEGRRILTNAHVVLYASQVEIQANQAGDKYPASVVAVAPGIDLAVLKLDDDKFFDSHPPLPRATVLPEIKDAVLAYGYPTGGDSLSITKGIVSRIEYTAYNFPVAGLRIQIDAAINPGNSGGPAVVGDKMIGLAFSHLGGAENISYIIPCEEIEIFLKDLASGSYHGKPAIFDDYQTLENPQLRAFLRLDKASGIIVNHPAGSDLSYPLKPWDLITKVGDTPVDNQGMVKVSDSLRVRFPYLFQKLATNGTVPITVIRESKEIKVDLPVLNSHPVLIPNLEGSYPSYFVYGPLVFSNAVTEFLGGYLRGEASGRIMSLFAYRGSSLVRRMGEKPAFDGERLVVVSSPFFPHKLAEGYSNPTSQVVKYVNGIAIKNLAHLVEVLRDCKDEFVNFEFEPHAGENLVFRRSDVTAATAVILTDNSILSQGSPDVMTVWNSKPSN